MHSATSSHHGLRQAITDLYSSNPDWVSFYRKTLGMRGLVRRHFPTLEALADFEQTELYRDIQRMVTELRRRGGGKDEKAEPTRVITVRIPHSLHETLRIEAFEHHTSMNKLCISKLIQFVDSEIVPAEAGEDVQPEGEREKAEDGL